MGHAQKRIGLVVGTIVIVATLISVAFCGDLQSENREAITRDLINLAIRAQNYYRRSIWEGGGGGTFVGLTADPNGLGRLTAKSITPNGQVAISSAGSPSSIVFHGIGTQLGNDGNLISVDIKVMADSTYVTYNN